jgi:histone H4
MTKIKLSKSKKTYKDNIQGLVKSRIHNICNKVGIKRVSGLIYEEIRGIAKIFLEDFLRQIITITEYYRRRTVSINDIYMATENHLLLNEKKIPKCKNTKKMQICLEFACAPFERLIREIGADFRTDLRFEEEAFKLIQYYTEQYLLKLLYDASLIMKTAHRETLQPKDLQVVRRSRNICQQ